MCNYRHISNGDNYNSKSIALNSKIALVPNLQADEPKKDGSRHSVWHPSLSRAWIELV